MFLYEPKSKKIRRRRRRRETKTEDPERTRHLIRQARVKTQPKSLAIKMNPTGKDKNYCNFQQTRTAYGVGFTVESIEKIQDCNLHSFEMPSQLKSFILTRSRWLQMKNLRYLFKKRRIIRRLFYNTVYLKLLRNVCDDW